MSGPATTAPVLFDLDGTVIDSVNLIRESHRHAVRTVLGLDLSDDELIVNVGRPLMEQMEHFSPRHAEELFHTYRTWNHAHTAELLRAYDGVDALLAELAQAGRAMGIVTSKSRDAVDLAWKVLPAVHARFSVVVTADDTPRHKPNPDPLFYALERLGGAAEGACYVGDAPFDIRAGRAAGLRTIGVTWGFFSRDELEGEGADLVVDTPGALLEACLNDI
ncbi:MAG TPA: HAD-IA family hydrolase [Miltoncostaeaceae bacterium]|nr:HAD-IA family hydrolase [Miltoncostaeaceae bacterium]